MVIMGLALIVLGPDKLPEVARWLGKASSELKKASNGVRREFYNALYAPAQEEVEKAKRELVSYKEKLEEEFKPHPNCPDTIRRLQEQEAQKLSETDSTIQNAAPAGVDEPLASSGEQKKV